MERLSQLQKREQRLRRELREQELALNAYEREREQLHRALRDFGVTQDALRNLEDDTWEEAAREMGDPLDIPPEFPMCATSLPEPADLATQLLIGPTQLVVAWRTILK